MKKNAEEYNQIFVVSFLKKLQLAGCDFEFWHCPNSGKRHKAEAAKFKLMGVLPGVPDIQVMAYNLSFFIEFKLGEGRMSSDQISFKEKAGRYGFKVYEIYGDSPKEYVDAVASIMQESLGLAQSVISKCSTSALGALGAKS